MRFIIDNKPRFYDIDKNKISLIKDKLSRGEKISQEEEELYLKSIVTKIRLIIEKLLGMNVRESAMINCCDFCQRVAGKVLENEGIEVFPKETQKILSPDVIAHSFLTIRFNDTDYLIDLNYRQFFMYDSCQFEKFVVVDNRVLLAPDPGFFVLNSGINKETAIKIIEDGFVELNEDTAKDYLDSFYYSKQGSSSYSNISGKIYLNALKKPEKRYTSTEEMIQTYYAKDYDEGKILSGNI